MKQGAKNGGIRNTKGGEIKNCVSEMPTLIRT